MTFQISKGRFDNFRIYSWLLQKKPSIDPLLWRIYNEGYGEITITLIMHAINLQTAWQIVGWKKTCHYTDTFVCHSQHCSANRSIDISRMLHYYTLCPAIIATWGTYEWHVAGEQKSDILPSLRLLNTFIKNITLRFMHVRSALRFVSIGVHVQSMNTNNNQPQG
jgi:hypothetical protein